MKEERRLEFKNPNEQLELMALVNRFCERELGEFNPDMHLEEAIRIVKALEPKIEASSNNIERRITSKPPSSELTIVGATEFGEVKATVNNNGGKGQNITKIVKGEEKEYRIGQYIVKKYVVSKGRTGLLTFEDFWDHGRINNVLGNYPPFWAIMYDLKSLEVKQIAKCYANAHLEKSNTIEIGFFYVRNTPDSLFVDYVPKVVWEAKPTN